MTIWGYEIRKWCEIIFEIEHANMLKVNLWSHINSAGTKTSLLLPT